MSAGEEKQILSLLENSSSARLGINKYKYMPAQHYTANEPASFNTDIPYLFIYVFSFGLTALRIPPFLKTTQFFVFFIAHSSLDSSLEHTLSLKLIFQFHRDALNIYSHRP